MSAVTSSFSKPLASPAPRAILRLNVKPGPKLPAQRDRFLNSFDIAVQRHRHLRRRTSRKHREEDVDDLVGDQEAAQHRGGHRPDDLGADAGGPEHRGEADDGGALGQQLGPQPVDGAFEDGLAELRQRRDLFQPAARSIASRR